MKARSSALAIVVAMLAVAACDPFGLPATRSLENGVAGMLAPGSTFEMKGGYTAGGTTWQIDLKVAGAKTRYVKVTSGQESLEAITVGADAYYRGQKFLADRLAGNPNGASLARAAGNAWWKGSPGQAPALPDFTDGTTFRSTFLGSAVASRNDHPDLGGTVELSGERAGVYIDTAPPYELRRVQLQKGVVVDGISDATMDYSNAGQDFHIAAPIDLIDFSNQSTLPPIYTVISVDTSRCTSPCVVAATLKNLGGSSGARARSSVTFTMSDPATGRTLGSCNVTVQPDVGYNATTTVSCTIQAQATNAAVVTAVADNPGRA